MELQVLRALTAKDGWTQLGGSFREDYFLDPESRIVFKALWRYWINRGEVDPAPIETVKSMIDLVEPKEEKRFRAYDTLETVYEYDPLASQAVAREAIYFWRAREILTEAESDLASLKLVPAHVADQFNSLDRALHPLEKKPRSLFEAASILEGEIQGAKYSTGIMDLDDALDGGLWSGELGVIVGKTFGGKTWALVSLGAAALKSGHPVLHFTTEINRARTAARYYQNLLGLPRATVIRKPGEVESRMQSLTLPPWEVLDYSATGVRVGTIRQKVQDFINQLRGNAPEREEIRPSGASGTGTPEKKVPLILVDHLDLDTVFPNDLHLKERFALTSSAESLRQIAVEFEVGLWTAVQANRPGFGAEYIQMEHVAESLGVARKADVVLTLNQSLDEREAGQLRISVAKARERNITRRVVPVKALADVQRLEQIEGV